MLGKTFTDPFTHACFSCTWLKPRDEKILPQSKLKNDFDIVLLNYVCFTSSFFWNALIRIEACGAGPTSTYVKSISQCICSGHHPRLNNDEII